MWVKEELHESSTSDSARPKTTKQEVGWLSTMPEHHQTVLAIEIKDRNVFLLTDMF